MNEIAQSFGNLDAAVVLWIAGAAAAVFVFIVIFDAFKQRRRLARLTGGKRPNRADKFKIDSTLIL